MSSSSHPPEESHAGNNLVPEKVLIIVCSYNEIANVPILLDQIHVSVPDADILVIDDSSPDGTSQWVQEAIDRDAFGGRLKLKTRKGKLGLGSAIRNGLQTAIDEGYQSVVNLDADLSHNPERIPALIQARQQSRVPIAIGSRYVPGGGLVNCSWKRKFVSRSANIYARWLLGWSVSDCSSAFRCYEVASLKKLPWSKIECDGYGFLEEILWYLIHQASDPKKAFVEVPIIYTERQHGASKISIREGTGTLKVLHRLARCGAEDHVAQSK